MEYIFKLLFTNLRNATPTEHHLFGASVNVRDTFSLCFEWIILRLTNEAVDHVVHLFI